MGVFRGRNSSQTLNVKIFFHSDEFRVSSTRACRPVSSTAPREPQSAAKRQEIAKDGVSIEAVQARDGASVPAVLRCSTISTVTAWKDSWTDKQGDGADTQMKANAKAQLRKQPFLGHRNGAVCSGGGWVARQQSTGNTACRKAKPGQHMGAPSTGVRKYIRLAEQRKTEIEIER